MTSRYKAPSTLSHRERSLNANTPSYTPPASGRSTPFYSAPGSSLSSNNSLSNSYGTESSSWQAGRQRSADELESQNDERLEGITAKVKLLKNLTTGIGNEIRESTVQLSHMNDAFSETSGILSGTFRRMNTMATRQGGRWACYMIFIVLVFWFFVSVWFLRKMGY